MLKDQYQFACPCCGKQIEIDTRSGKARAVKVEESRNAQGLDQLVAKHKHEGQRLGDLFDSARDQVKNDTDRLANELGKAKKAAKDDKDDGKRPLRPFDLD